MKLKKYDKLVILFLLAISLALGIVTKNSKKNLIGDYLLVELDGKEYGRYPLDQDRIVEVKSNKTGLNKIEIKDHKAKMIYANCPDGLCMRMPRIGTKGETIICLPHKLYLEVISEGDSEEDLDGVVR